MADPQDKSQEQGSTEELPPLTEGDIEAIRLTSIAEAMRECGWPREKAEYFADAFAEGNRAASHLKIVRG